MSSSTSPPVGSRLVPRWRSRSFDIGASGIACSYGRMLFFDLSSWEAPSSREVVRTYRGGCCRWPTRVIRSFWTRVRCTPEGGFWSASPERTEFYLGPMLRWTGVVARCARTDFTAADDDKRGNAMSWEFETDAEFEEHLAWMREFMREEVEPLGLVYPARRLQDAAERGHQAPAQAAEASGEGPRPVGRAPRPRSRGPRATAR